MAIRDTLVSLIGGKHLQQERAKTQEAFDLMTEAYQSGRFRVTPDMLVERLAELDSSTIAYLMRQMQSTSLGFAYQADTEQQRIYQVNESRYAWLYNPLAQWTVWTWTNNGMGEKVTVTCNDEEAQKLWEEAWEYSTLFDDDRIQEMSNWVCVDGEIFIAAFHSIADGSTTFELLDTDEIKEIITDPDNKNKPLWYKREYIDANSVTQRLYYPCYYSYFNKPEDLKKVTLPSDAVTTISEAMDENNGTAATVLHIANNRKDQSNLHGWPILGIAAPYFRAQKEYVESRLTVAKQKAMFVRDVTTSGGSRGVAAVQARFQTGLTSGSSSTVDTNPAAVSGSSLIHNKAVENKDLPMTTGAGDATSDNNMFSWMALLGAGLFTATAGLDTQRYATALEMDKNQSVLWSKYQSFWSCQFRKMVEIVLLAAEKWGGKTFEDKTCKVSIDTLSLVDFPGVVTPIASMLDALTESNIPDNAKLEIQQALWYPVLTALGTEDVGEILSDDMFGIVEPEKAAEVARGMIETAIAIRHKIQEKGAEDVSSR